MISGFLDVGVAAAVAGILVFGHCLAVLAVKGPQIRGWRDVPGHLDYLDVQTATRTDGRGMWARKITTIKASYGYEFGAAHFVGAHVDITDYFPRIGDFDRGDLAGSLKSAFDGDRAVRVFVNPDDPHEAVLTQRTPENPVVGCSLLFAASVGFLIMLVAWRPTPSTTGWVVGVGVGFAMYFYSLFG